ncbi:MAG: hypothetical protein VB122_06740 [Erysipelotrichales bacterium]|nr:hypothetical protein [Erysipelotrichales bacterium]
MNKEYLSMLSFRLLNASITDDKVTIDDILCRDVDTIYNRLIEKEVLFSELKEYENEIKKIIEVGVSTWGISEIKRKFMEDATLESNGYLFLACIVINHINNI